MSNKSLDKWPTEVFLGAAAFRTKGTKPFLSPVRVRADLHNAPGAAHLTFLQLIVYDQLSRLQHRHKKMGCSAFLVMSPQQKDHQRNIFSVLFYEHVFYHLNSLRQQVFGQDFIMLLSCSVHVLVLIFACNYFSPLTWRSVSLEQCQSSGLHTACLLQSAHTKRKIFNMRPFHLN